MDKKVFLVPCENYRDEEVVQSTDHLFQLMGGLKQWIKPGFKVLLKVNLLMKKPPEAAVTTHPSFVEAVVRQIQELGGQVIIADSPGGPLTKSWLKGIYRETGMEEVANKTGAQLNWDTEQQSYSFPEGKILKQITLLKIIKEVDLVISMAKLKTHGFTIYTGAVKNLFGTIPGLLKADYHVRMSDVRDFSNMLVDVAEFVKPQLSLMDAVIGMEGPGPSAGDPKQVGFLGASINPHALDLAFTHLIGLNPSQVFTIQKAMDRGLIPKNYQELDIQGMNKNDLNPIPFKIPISSKSKHIPIPLPYSIDRFLYNILRPSPSFIHEKCVGCGICVQNCPAKCIQLINKKAYPDLSKCIRCFCCQELCPYHAVEIKRGKLSQILFH